MTKKTKKQKVLIVNSYIPWGGLGQFTLSLAQGLNSEEYVVYGLVTHSKIDNFEAFKNLTHTTTYLGNLNKFVKYFVMLLVIWKLKPKVIIINYNALIHFLLPYIPKTTVISIIHNDIDDFYRISKINHPYVNAWVAPTPGIKEGFVNYANLDRVKSDTIVIPHGISKSKTVRKKHDGAELNLAFVGAVLEHKGADLLPQIMENILTKLPFVKLRIIGTGELKPIIKSEFEFKGISKNIEFIGVVSNEQVREILSQSDILLFPTRVEAFGLVIAEAMMEGAVPIVTLLPGITDATVEDGKTGFLIQKDDVCAFAKRVIELGSDLKLLRTMSLKSQETAKKDLSLSMMSQNYKNLIDKEINDAF